MFILGFFLKFIFCAAMCNYEHFHTCKQAWTMFKKKQQKQNCDARQDANVWYSQIWQWTYGDQIGTSCAASPTFYQESIPPK